jgi:hypothetical protein
MQYSIAQQRHVSYLNIVGDSKNTIIYFVTRSTPKDGGLKVLFERIQNSLSNLSIQFFHILRENNKKDDEMANIAIGLAPGSLWVSGEVNFVIFPLMKRVWNLGGAHLGCVEYFSVYMLLCSGFIRGIIQCHISDPRER